MSFMISATTAFAGVSAYGAYQSAVAGNEQADRASDNARRRYEVKSGISKNQMEEQQTIALEKMTDVTRQFMKARGQAKAIQAETGVAGITEQKKIFDFGAKESETKGRVAKEIDTNVINIAQGMLADKVDTDAMIQEALSKKKGSLSILTDTVVAGAGGALQGYQLGSGLSKLSSPSTLSGTTPAVSTQETGFLF